MIIHKIYQQRNIEMYGKGSPHQRGLPPAGGSYYPRLHWKTSPEKFQAAMSSTTTLLCHHFTSIRRTKVTEICRKVWLANPPKSVSRAKVTDIERFSGEGGYLECSPHRGWHHPTSPAFSCRWFASALGLVPCRCHTGTLKSFKPFIQCQYLVWPSTALKILSCEMRI